MLTYFTFAIDMYILWCEVMISQKFKMLFRRKNEYYFFLFLGTKTADFNNMGQMYKTRIFVR